MNGQFQYFPYHNRRSAIAADEMGSGVSRRRNRDIECPRRFPPPWSVEELDACFVVKDSTAARR